MLASSTSSAGASSVWGSTVLISWAASLIDTVGVSDSSLPFVDVSVLLDDPVADVSVLLVSEPGTSAPEGAVEVADDSADSLALSDVEVVSGVEGAVLGAVVVTGAVVASATLGSAGSTVVTGGATAVDGDSAGACVSGACVSGAWVLGGLGLRRLLSLSRRRLRDLRCNRRRHLGRRLRGHHFGFRGRHLRRRDNHSGGRRVIAGLGECRGDSPGQRRQGDHDTGRQYGDDATLRAKF